MRLLQNRSEKYARAATARAQRRTEAVRRYSRQGFAGASTGMNVCLSNRCRNRNRDRNRCRGGDWGQGRLGTGKISRARRSARNQSGVGGGSAASAPALHNPRPPYGVRRQICDSVIAYRGFPRSHVLTITTADCLMTQGQCAGKGLRGRSGDGALAPGGAASRSTPGSVFFPLLAGIARLVGSCAKTICFCGGRPLFRFSHTLFGDTRCGEKNPHGVHASRNRAS